MQLLPELREAVARNGAIWEGVQESLPPALPDVCFINPTTGHRLSVPFNPISVEPLLLAAQISYVLTLDTGKTPDTCEPSKEKTMTLREKLHKVYTAVDLIEKRGYNKAQSYKYIRSADVTNAIRKQLIELGIYAEINYDFVGTPYTIARAREKDAPFTAVNVRCTIVFHDLEMHETITSSGLGTGADTGDKAAYKAQTGALKYALKNAFLVPDEADPEADESVDEGYNAHPAVQDEIPDFQDARHAAPRANAAPKAKSAPAARPEAPLPQASPFQDVPLGTAAPSTASQDGTSPAPAAEAPETTSVAPTAVREPGDEPADDRLPTEEEMAIYRKEFTKLADDLSTEGKLKSGKSLPINRKLMVFLLSVTGSTAPKDITKAGWDKFFQKVNTTKAQKDLVYLAEKVNEANGIEAKK